MCPYFAASTPLSGGCIDGRRAPFMGICRSDSAKVAPNEILPMDMKDVIEFLQATARSAGAEVSSPWFYLQFGLILVAAGIAYAADAAVRARVDMTSFAMRWPLPLRR